MDSDVVLDQTVTDKHFLFGRWEGACVLLDPLSDRVKCKTTMTSQRSITALFNKFRMLLLPPSLGGHVEVSSGNWGGASCGEDCYLVKDGIEIQLVGYPNVDFILSGWGNDCKQTSGSSPCTLIMDSDKIVTASFQQIPQGQSSIISYAKRGKGSIKSQPEGIDCEPNCSTYFTVGSSLSITAKADVGYRLDYLWVPDDQYRPSYRCTALPCTLVVKQASLFAQEISGIFRWVGTNKLSININGKGRIKSSSNEEIQCTTNCLEVVTTGTNVTLTAVPDIRYIFSGWTEDCSGTGTCSVLMDGDKAVSANFVEVPSYPVTVTKQSGGVVSSEPQGINCGGTNKQCKGQFSAVQLTATPNAGFELIKWVGCDNWEANVCSLQPTKKTTVKAVFKALPKYTLKVTKNKLGSITSDPAGLNCPDKKKACSAKFTKGTQITLTPVPQAGRSFAGWTGACSGLDACSIVMDGGKGVGAMFQ